MEPALSIEFDDWDPLGQKTNTEQPSPTQPQRSFVVGTPTRHTDARPTPGLTPRGPAKHAAAPTPSAHRASLNAAPNTVHLTRLDPAETGGFDRDEGLGDDNLWVQALALPLTLLTAIAIQQSDFLKLLFFYPSVIFHEFGHAFIGWFASHQATPFILWTNISADASVVVYVCFSFLLGVAAWAGVHQKRIFITVVAALGFVMQTWLTFFASEEAFDAACSAAGMGGEFALSALVIVAFYHRLPKQFHWEVLRFVALPVAVHVFVNAYWLWWRISDNFSLVPWGSAMYGQTDANGDFNRLRHDHDWLIGDMVDFYLTLGGVCAFIILAHYVFHTARTWRLRQQDQPT